VLFAAVPATAGASIRDELAAANMVERNATHEWPRYNFVANCDQESRTRFWCDVIGQSGNCYWEGHASVRMGRRYWWVQLRGMDRSCY
jgi:hypothetical protein